jgi:hypothetical protein
MKTLNKTKLTAIILLAMFVTSSFLLVAKVSVNAQVGVPQPVKTVGYITVAPTLIGVGQTATVNLWIFPLPDNYFYQASYLGFNGITVTFIKPNGTKDTFAPVDATGIYDPGQTQSLGALYFYYEPDMAGDWSVSFTMPAQDITDSTGTVQYMACTSNSFSFTVTEEEQLAGMLNGYPWAQLPNENTYWKYPINSNNREWNQISGDWLGSSLTGLTVTGTTSRLWQPYGSGPNTPHIVWKQPYKAGGLIGGDYGSLSYSSAITTASATIMAGKVFMNIPNENNFECIDLATGEILYTAPGQITMGIHLPGNPYAQSLLATPGQTTVFLSSYGNSPTSYLFSSGGRLLTPGGTWNYYDPFTGTLMMSIANASTASYVLIDGTNLAYGTTLDGQLFAWNLEKVIERNFLTEFYGAPGTALIGDWPAGIMWTRPLPTPLASGSGLISSAPTVFATSTDASTIVLRTNPNQYWGYSAEDGTQLWNLNLTYPALINEQISLYGVNDFVVFDPTETTFHCYSMLNGAELWESPSFADSPWATTWTVYGSETNDYDNFYTMFPDGTMAAMSLATGKLDWRNTAIPSTEYTANAVPYVTPMLMVGGNIYAYAGSSNLYQQNPIPRFAMLTCVNANTGDTTWTLNGGVMPIAAANGYVIGYGMSDGNLYCVGKGPTKTTVSAPQTAVPKGTAMVISGSVLDMSPTIQDYGSQVLFPNGVPAVADEDISAFMDYLYMQNATLMNSPPMPTGVPVIIDAIDPSGNYVNLGEVTSDFSGMFKLLWTPDMEGEYTIIAGFGGSDSYWSSYATTAVGVGPAPAANGQVEPEPTTEPLISTEVAIAVAVISVAVVAVVGYLVYRRRK